MFTVSPLLGTVSRLVQCSHYSSSIQMVCASLLCLPSLSVVIWDFFLITVLFSLRSNCGTGQLLGGAESFSCKVQIDGAGLLSNSSQTHQKEECEVPSYLLHIFCREYIFIPPNMLLYGQGRPCPCGIHRQKKIWRPI